MLANVKRYFSFKIGILSMLSFCMSGCKIPASAEIQLPSLTDVPVNLVIPFVYKGEYEFTREDFENEISFREGCTETQSSETDPTAPKDPNKPAEEKDKTKKASVAGSELQSKSFNFFKIEPFEKTPDGKTIYHYQMYFVPPLLKPSRRGEKPSQYEIEVKTFVNENDETILGNKICFTTASKGIRFAREIDAPTIQMSTGTLRNIDQRQFVFLGFSKPIDPAKVKSGTYFCDGDKLSNRTTNEGLCGGQSALNVKAYSVISLKPNEDGWILNTHQEYAIQGVGLKDGGKYNLTVELKGTGEDKEYLPIPQSDLVIKNRVEITNVKDLKPYPSEVYKHFKAKQLQLNLTDEKLKGLSPQLFKING